MNAATGSVGAEQDALAVGPRPHDVDHRPERSRRPRSDNHPITRREARCPNVAGQFDSSSRGTRTVGHHILSEARYASTTGGGSDVGGARARSVECREFKTLRRNTPSVDLYPAPANRCRTRSSARRSVEESPRAAPDPHPHGCRLLGDRQGKRGLGMKEEADQSLLLRRFVGLRCHANLAPLAGTVANGDRRDLVAILGGAPTGQRPARVVLDVREHVDRRTEAGCDFLIRQWLHRDRLPAPPPAATPVASRQSITRSAGGSAVTRSRELRN